LCARLQPSNRDGAASNVEELERMVAQIRVRWPKTRIVIRITRRIRLLRTSACPDQDLFRLVARRLNTM